MSETIRIRYLSDKIEKLRAIDGKSDWIDLRAAEDVVMKKGDFYLIPLGVAMQLPEGYEAHIVPRSSTFKNFGIIQTNHQGVIDNSYSGDNDEWKMAALAMRDTEIHVNDRICQFRIMKQQPPIVFEETDSLPALRWHFPVSGAIMSHGKNDCPGDRTEEWSKIYENQNQICPQPHRAYACRQPSYSPVRLSDRQT